MTDDELSRLLDEYADAALTRRSIPIRFKAARAAILSHFDRRKEGEGGEDALPPIDRDESYQRDYIPLPGGWEIQTKGRGSSFRICDTKDGERWLVADEYLHAILERMAREVRAAYESRPTPAGEGVTEAMLEAKGALELLVWRMNVAVDLDRDADDVAPEDEEAIRTGRRALRALAALNNPPKSE